MEKRKGQLKEPGQVLGWVRRHWYRKQSQRKANEQNYLGKGAPWARGWARGEPD